MEKRLKPIRKIPSYMKGMEANRAVAAGGSKAHPDYFVPAKETLYWVALLPAHPKHPKDEDGNPMPYVTVKRYFSYKTPDGDVRNWPVQSDELVEAGKDPLYKRAIKYMNTGDQEEWKFGNSISAKVRVLMNVVVIAMKEKNSKTMKRGKDLGELGSRPHIMEIGGKTWTEGFKPLIEDVDIESGESEYYDIFGQNNDVVPIIQIKKVSTGSRAVEVEWHVKRIDKTFEITDKLRNAVINIVKHETNIPHTQKELQACLALAAADDAAKTSATDETDFSEVANDYEETDEEDTEDVEESEDEDEEESDEDEDEEEAPKKKRGRPKKSESAPAKKVKKTKKVEEEEDEDEEDDEDLEDDEDEEEEPAPKKKKVKKSVEKSSKKKAKKKSKDGDEDEDDFLGDDDDDDDLEDL